MARMCVDTGGRVEAQSPRFAAAADTPRYQWKRRDGLLIRWSWVRVPPPSLLLSTRQPSRRPRGAEPVEQVFQLPQVCFREPPQFGRLTVQFGAGDLELLPLRPRRP